VSKRGITSGERRSILQKGQLGDCKWSTSESFEQHVYDVFLGDSPVRLTIHRGGRIGVEDGRHRVMAAIEAGSTRPVELTFTD